jgi:hypothetical protein
VPIILQVIVRAGLSVQKGTTPVRLPAPGLAYQLQLGETVNIAASTAVQDIQLSLSSKVQPQVGSKTTFIADPVHSYNCVMLDQGAVHYDGPPEALATGTPLAESAELVERKFRIRTRGGSAGSVGTKFRVARNASNNGTIITVTEGIVEWKPNVGVPTEILAGQTKEFAD